MYPSMQGLGLVLALAGIGLAALVLGAGVSAWWMVNHIAIAIH